MYQHLKDRQYYEDIYDRVTVHSARMDLKYFMKFHDEWFKIMPDEKPTSLRSTFHLNLVYMLMVGDDLLDRHDKRNSRVSEMMAEDEAKDKRIADARLTHEPVCQHCGITGLRITDKLLTHRNSIDSPEEVLFMLKCSYCGKNSNYWEDGAAWEKSKTNCPKCKGVMNERDVRRGKAITTTYICPNCGHSYKSKLDFSVKKDKPDPVFEADRAMFCFHDPKSLQEHRDAKDRHDNLRRWMDEAKEKADNKHIYDAIADLKKPKIAELTEILAPVLAKASYAEFNLDKPEMGQDVFIGFSCLDTKSDREDYDSRKTLQKLVKQTLEDTNWRLTSDGISYRLGYLTGRLHAYEREEDIKNLVMKSKKLKLKPNSNKVDAEKNAYIIKDKDGNDIHL